MIAHPNHYLFSPVTTTPRLQRISEADLDGLFAELRRQGTTELVLLGPGAHLPASVDLWPQELRDKPRIYQLIEPVEALAERLAELTQLTSLNLEDNEIGDKGAASLAALTQLTTLDLWNNQIGDEGAASLAALTQLTKLDLSENPVVETTPFAALRRLTFLNLKEAKVQDLSPLQPLLERGLEAKWEKYGAGNGINVYNCPLINPPPEIVQQGQAAVLNYLREIEAQGEDHLYEAKVLILGDGGAGKTTLLRRLYQTDQPMPAEEESTKGIDIHRHTFMNPPERPFHLNVWDFGGQQIYHATHQFFLTKRSLYILVDDTRNSSQAVQDDGFKY